MSMMLRIVDVVVLSLWEDLDDTKIFFNRGIDFCNGGLKRYGTTERATLDGFSRFRLLLVLQ